MPPIYGNIGSNSYDTLVPNALNNFSTMVGQRLNSWENSDQLFDRTIQGVLNRRQQVAAQKRAEAERKKMFGRNLAVTGGTALVAGGLTAGLGAIPAMTAPALAAADAGAVGAVGAEAASTAAADVAAPMGDAAKMIGPDLGTADIVTGAPSLTSYNTNPVAGIQSGGMPSNVTGPSMPLSTSKIPQWNYAFGPTAGTSAARGFGLGALSVISPGAAGMVAGTPAFSPLAAAHLGLYGEQMGLDAARTAAVYDEMNDPGRKDLRNSQTMENLAHAKYFSEGGSHNQVDPLDSLETKRLREYQMRAGQMTGEPEDIAYQRLGLLDNMFNAGGGAGMAQEGYNHFYGLQKSRMLPEDYANPWKIDDSGTWKYKQPDMWRAQNYLQEQRKKRMTLSPGLR